MTLEQLNALGNKTLTLVREVGRFITQEAQAFSQQAVEVKSKNSLVSYVDKTAEQKLVEGLSHLLPEAGFIAEEGTSNKVGEVYNWIIDPLDGTTNFIHGIPTYSISVALQESEAVVLGIVLELGRDECFYSWKGQPAYLNGSPIATAVNANLADSLIATGFPYYDYERLQPYMNLLQHYMHETRGIRRIGSAAVDLAYVACGRFDAFFEYALNPWDVAAGAFLVQQAGGKVVDFSEGSNFLHGREIVATSTPIYSPFIEPLKHFIGQQV